MARPTKPVKKKKSSHAVVVAGMRTPVSDKHRAFCDRWLRHYDHVRAAKEAGYNSSFTDKGGAMELFRKYERYLLQQKALKEKAVAKELVLEQRDILREMMAIGFANAQDYVKVVDEAVVDEKSGVTRVVKCERRRPLMELTRAEAAAVSKVTFHPDGTVSYELPDERSKHPYLKDLGQHLGLFHPKLIQEHRHAHAVALLDLSSLDNAKLKKAEELFLEAMGPEGRRMIGIEDVVDGEFEEMPEE